MDFKALTAADEMWDRVKDYAENCSWRAGKSLAHNMENNRFLDWERVIAAMEDETVCGFCTVTGTDCIPDVPYTPYIGYLFVGERHRGCRLGEKLIRYAMEYLKSVGFDRAYLVSDHVGLYEKYGFCVVDRKISPWGTEEKIYLQEIR